jgi:D-alanyl-D-alanine carboxypeptidase
VVATVLKMVEHKKLRLEDKVSQYFKNENWFFNLPNAPEITIRMLLNHTSGIPEYVYNEEIWKSLKANPDKIWTGEERLYYSSIQPAVNPPGKAWSYADANYIILGMIIEKIEGKSFYELADEWFISPLKLSNTKPAIHRQIKGLVSGYTGMTEEMFLPEKMVSNGKYAFNPQLEWTGGGFVTTVSDLCIWAMELYGGEILSGELKNEMLSSSGFQTTLVENAGYGLGVFIGKTNNILYYGHTGFVPGFRTVMEYLPEYKIALAMQVNTDKISQGKHPIMDLNVLKSLINNYIDKN